MGYIIDRDFVILLYIYLSGHNLREWCSNCINGSLYDGLSLFSNGMFDLFDNNNEYATGKVFLVYCILDF